MRVGPGGSAAFTLRGMRWPSRSSPARATAWTRAGSISGTPCSGQRRVFHSVCARTGLPWRWSSDFSAGSASPGSICRAQSADGPGRPLVSGTGSRHLHLELCGGQRGLVSDRRRGGCRLRWRATFIAGGIGPLLSICALGLLPASSNARTFGRQPPPFHALLRNRALTAYVAAFAGNTWEVFAVRVWFVAYLAWLLHLPGNHIA